MGELECDVGRLLHNRCGDEMYDLLHILPMSRGEPPGALVNFRHLRLGRLLPVDERFQQLNGPVQLHRSLSLGFQERLDIFADKSSDLGERVYPVGQRNESLPYPHLSDALHFTTVYVILGLLRFPWLVEERWLRSLLLQFFVCSLHLDPKPVGDFSPLGFRNLFI